MVHPHLVSAEHVFELLRTSVHTAMPRHFAAPPSVGRRADRKRCLAGTHPAVGVLSFDGPVLSSRVPLNVATSRSAAVTVSGLSFGAADATVSVSYAAFACATTAWLSTTTVACGTSSDVAHSMGTGAVTVVAVAGTANAALTFDAPVLSSSDGNLLATGFASVTVSRLKQCLVLCDLVCGTSLAVL